MTSNNNQEESTSMLADNANVNIDISTQPASSSTTQVSKLAEMESSDDNSRVGLNKEELMKFANQPFWVRLRNILFAAFWVLWLSILGAAIGYVIQSPSCVSIRGGLNSTAVTTPSTSLSSQ